MEKGFYYRGNYYLLPPGYESYDEFRNMLRNSSRPVAVEAVWLQEDHQVQNGSVTKGISIAPYFLSGYHDEPQSVTIEEPSEVYPAPVEVCDQMEYNARLREKILEHCPGCLKYKPLSNQVQSLNSHFDEMSLDGVCMLRQETKPSPRSFHHNLYSFGGFYMRFNYFDRSATEMAENLKESLYTRYSSAELQDQEQRKLLTLGCGKKELLLPIVTGGVSSYLMHITKGKYLIRLAEPITDIRAMVENVLSPENGETFAKECKKYGVSIGVLEYNREGKEQVFRALEDMLRHFKMFLLYEEEGKASFLLSDTSCVLAMLRYHTPILRSLGAKIRVYSQYGNREYGIDYSMSFREL